MKRILGLIFSMKLVTVGLFLFLTSIGVATFIESVHGVQASKIVVYNAGWFTALLLYLSLALMFNIYLYRMWQREKIALLSFHVAFLIIMVGAAVTRYRGFEGQLVAREGETVDYMYTADPKLLISIRDSQKTTVEGYPAWLSDWNWVKNRFSHEIQHSNKTVTIEYKDFIANAIDTFEFNGTSEKAILDLVVGQMKSNYLEYGDKLLAGSLPIAYNDQSNEGVSLKLSGGKILLRSAVPLRMLPMTRMMEARQTGMPIPDSAYQTIPTNTWVTANIKTLYQSGSNQFVLKNVFYHAEKKLKKAALKNQGMDYLTVDVFSGKERKQVRLKGGQNNIPEPEYFSLNGLYVQLEYGAVKRSIPFNVICDEFKLKNYPGSDAPSSFESYIRIEDPKNNYSSKRHIFMNHVTDYVGYRFFQSSYELDNPSTPENEEGTKLSVNHDAWGTNITYLGYLLMSIGMILSIFAPKSRFRGLNDALSKLKKNSVIIVFLLLGFTGFSQEDPSKIVHVISEEHSESLASLLIQDQSGRIMPMHTLSDQLLRKIHGSNSYKDYNAVQTVLSWHMYGRYWMKQPILLVPSAVRARLNLKKYCSLEELTTQDNHFKFEKEYAAAHGKAEKFQDEFEKKLIKLTERFQVFQGAISWQFLTIIPKKNDKNNRWYVPMSMEIQGEDTISNLVALKYFYSLVEASRTQDYTNSNSLLGNLKLIQRTISKTIVPSESKVSYEIRYNKLTIFKTVYQGYMLLGLLLLTLYIAGLFGNSPKRSKVLQIIKVILIALSTILFLYHGTGLGFRWYISGHAPWSNGYEAIVFISWVTVLAGGLFLRKIEVSLSVALILSAMMLFVSELNLLDPEISPLVPVLKSYWLMIHVAIITSSYAFLGLSFILGLLNLFFFIFQRSKNREKLGNHIQQITAVNEMTMTVGIFMLTIGTFLGGVWANESWGRYWGWDPKETWALVSILVYAIILHLRFIPALKSAFVFNLWSFWGYSAILFTYFGVNFMLVGLHSYAQGDGLGSFPNWLIYTLVFFVLLSILSYVRYRKSQKPA